MFDFVCVAGVARGGKAKGTAAYEASCRSMRQVSECEGKEASLPRSISLSMAGDAEMRTS